MPVSRDYDYTQFTPLDNTLSQYDIFKSAYKNIRFGVATTQKYKIKNSDVANLPGLSYRLFGTPNLWRVLLHFNGLNDPVSDIVVGMELNVPSKADIIAYISKQQNNANPVLTI